VTSEEKAKGCRSAAIHRWEHSWRTSWERNPGKFLFSAFLIKNLYFVPVVTVV
jgi:hypothetical protein